MLLSQITVRSGTIERDSERLANSSKTGSDEQGLSTIWPHQYGTVIVASNTSDGAIVRDHESYRVWTLPDEVDG